MQRRWRWRFARAAAAILAVTVAGAIAGRPAPLRAAAVTWRIAARLSMADVTAMAVSPDGRTGAVLLGRPASVVWIDLASGKVAGRVGLGAVPRFAAFSGDGRTLVVTYADCAFGPGPCTAATTASLLSVAAGRVRTVAIGSGAGSLCPIGTGPDVLVAASGSGDVDLIDTRTARVVAVFPVGSGVLAQMAVDAGQSLAAVANVTAGTVTFLHLGTGRTGAVGNVSYEIGGMAFLIGRPYLFAGQAQGEVVDLLHTTDGSRPALAGAVDGVGTLVYLPQARVLAAAGVRSQTVAILRIDAAPSTPAYRVFAGLTQVPIGPAAAGTVTGLVAAGSGQALLASSAHGLAILSAPAFAVSQRFLPSVLGGVPGQIAAAGGNAALVLAGANVDVVTSAPPPGAKA